MSNVVQMNCSCEYFVSRAARHRRAGRYDEAMALLTKARDQFGVREEIELETAYVYDAMGCDEDASRCYLRVVRDNGSHKAEALFHLALSALQRSDVSRSAAYYQQFSAIRQTEISSEISGVLSRQIREAMQNKPVRGRRSRAAALERRAVQRMQEGKTAAAKRAVIHALNLHETAQRHTLLSCCCLLRAEMQEAVHAAECAHLRAPSHVQTLCVLSDAYAAAGQAEESRRTLYLAALRARDPDDLFAAAMESAKHGEDRLTLRLTHALLRREPYHTRAMMMRGCAFVNLNRLDQAGKVFARLCGLTPEDTVCEWLHKLCREKKRPENQLEMGMDVSMQEGRVRALTLIEMLYKDPDEIRADAAQLRTACRLSAWAFRSPVAGSRTATLALILMSGLNVPQTRCVLLDAITDPMIADTFKAGILQIMASYEGFKPYDVDFGGRLVKLAAGGVSDTPVRHGEINQRIVQRACDALAPGFPDAPQVLLPIFLSYLSRYGEPRGRMEDACAAALEYVYHTRAGRQIALRRIAGRYGVSERLCLMCVQRMMRVGR